jgi:hypothetical protein
MVGMCGSNSRSLQRPKGDFSQRARNRAKPIDSAAPWVDFLSDDPERLVTRKIVQNCPTFSSESMAALQSAVNDAYTTSSGNGSARFVSSGFAPEKSAFAPRRWLFGVDGVDLSEGEVVTSRHTSRDRHDRDLVQCWVCYRASAGHPNSEGTRQYATQILAVLRRSAADRQHPRAQGRVGNTKSLESPQPNSARPGTDAHHRCAPRG